MACNLPMRGVHLISSDTLSEISESTGASHWDSREELRDLATKIGVQDVSELYQEKFRVDRKKLEHMLIGDNEAPEPADTFFTKLMEDTNTFITWPSRLKIGAKSKKDPHVRIAGRPEDVQAAKDRIVSILDTRCNRVTMKMDVSYTDHSHIIGKGGLSIKRVMEETQCHVHFPDSNRSNPSEKSNQVSIAGDIDGVERARSRVRNLTPLIFGFELPIMSQDIPDAKNVYIAKIQEQHNVQVMFRTRPKLHATLVMVKGCEWEVQQVKQAALLLVEFMCENLASQIAIQMFMEISPHHHPVVLGKNHANLKAIMKNTNTQILLADAQDPNIPNLKKSNVAISGNINNVYTARQQLMGSLPLILMFDLPEHTKNLPLFPDQLVKIQSSLDVVINIRNKAKQNTMACIIKGIERCAGNIYEARNRILGIDGPAIIADIPPAYFPLNLATPTLENPSTLVPTMSPLMSPLINPNTWQFPTATYNQPPPFVGIMQQPHFVYNVMHGSLASSGYQSVGKFSGSSMSSEQNHENTLSSISSMSSLSPAPSPRNGSPNYLRRPADSSGDPFDGETQGAKKRIDLAPSDYEQKRMAGFKAAQGRLGGDYRLSTNTWAGYGISQTSPCAFNLTRSHSESKEKTEDIWKSPVFNQSSPNGKYSSPPSTLNTSNYLDSTPSYIINRITSSKWSDLPTMLTSLGLEKYIGLFTSHEIDLTTFPSLTERDLIEIGVSAFGARRKMLLVISEFNKRSSPFSPAPGAERKKSASPREGW